MNINASKIFKYIKKENSKPHKLVEWVWPTVNSQHSVGRGRLISVRERPALARKQVSGQSGLYKKTLPVDKQITKLELPSFESPHYTNKTKLFSSFRRKIGRELEAKWS